MSDEGDNSGTEPAASDPPPPPPGANVPAEPPAFDPNQTVIGLPPGALEDNPSWQPGLGGAPNPPPQPQPGYGPQGSPQPPPGYAPPPGTPPPGGPGPQFGGHQAPPAPGTPPGAYPPGAAAPGWQQAPYGVPPHDPLAKSRMVAGILGIVLGGFGVHRFYLGDTQMGVIQIVVTILTCGIGSIWGLVEGIMILVGSEQFQTDASGRPLAP